MMAERLVVEIDNLTEAQAIALRDLFATWMSLSSTGSSRWTNFYADGDGNFHPRIKVNGERPAMTDLVTRDERWHVSKSPGESMYWMDFDRIAWRLHDKVKPVSEPPK